tara:strand:+ start:898 stop:1155 length:258 start_codon:yes stop_codon:yes gene_type:complete
MDLKIDFPCSYPIKVIGVTDKISKDVVYRISRLHFKGISLDDIQPKYSKEGNYVSFRLSVVAEGEQQLKAFHRTLMEFDGIKMVL